MAKILLVDDDVDLIEMNRLVLTRRGHDVACAYSAAEAREQLRTTVPDLIVLDVMMETQTAGLELVQELHRTHPDLPVLMLSAIRSATQRPPGPSFDAGRLPGVKFMDKPALPERLADEIEAMLTGRRNHGNANPPGG